MNTWRSHSCSCPGPPRLGTQRSGMGHPSVCLVPGGGAALPGPRAPGGAPLGGLAGLGAQLEVALPTPCRARQERLENKRMTQRFIEEFKKEQELRRRRLREEVEEENRKILAFANMWQQREDRRMAQVHEREERKRQLQQKVGGARGVCGLAPRQPLPVGQCLEPPSFLLADDGAPGEGAAGA